MAAGRRWIGWKRFRLVTAEDGRRMDCNTRGAKTNCSRRLRTIPVGCECRRIRPWTARSRPVTRKTISTFRLNIGSLSFPRNAFRFRRKSRCVSRARDIHRDPCRNFSRRLGALRPRRTFWGRQVADEADICLRRIRFFQFVGLKHHDTVVLAKLFRWMVTHKSVCLQIAVATVPSQFVGEMRSDVQIVDSLDVFSRAGMLGLPYFAPAAGGSWAVFTSLLTSGVSVAGPGASDDRWSVSVAPSLLSSRMARRIWAPIPSDAYVARRMDVDALDWPWAVDNDRNLLPRKRRLLAGPRSL